MYTTFLSCVHQSPFHCRTGQSGPGRVSAEGAALWGQIREVIWGATLCNFSLLSAFSTQTSWEAPEKAHTEGRLPIAWLSEVDRTEGESGTFSCKKSDSDTAMDFGLDAS